MIGPVKQEDEWDRPIIIRYHDIVSDREMEKIKELAKPRVRIQWMFHLWRNVSQSVCNVKC